MRKLSIYVIILDILIEREYKIKVLVSGIILSLSISSANADVFGIVKRNPLAFAVGVGFGTLYMQTNMHKARDLSYYLPKVDQYFKLHPQDFNPIAKYVLWALANPANKKDYDRYKRLAEVMGLDGIPPYVAPIHNQPTVLTNPAQEQDPNGNVLDNLIQEQPFGNIIYVAWDDNRYPVCQDIRDLLNNNGIRINDAENGVYLPTRKVTKNPNEAYHPEIHTKDYYENVYQELRQYNNDTQGMKNALKDIGQKLKNNQFKY